MGPGVRRAGGRVDGGGPELSSREAVDDAYARIVAAGHTSSVEPWDTVFGARYAIVCDPDGHRIGLKSPQDPTRSYPLET